MLHKEGLGGSERSHQEQYLGALGLGRTVLMRPACHPSTGQSLLQHSRPTCPWPVPQPCTPCGIRMKSPQWSAFRAPPKVSYLPFPAPPRHPNFLPLILSKRLHLLPLERDELGSHKVPMASLTLFQVGQRAADFTSALVSQYTDSQIPPRHALHSSSWLLYSHNPVYFAYGGPWTVFMSV